nr:hypothetical protein CFP56_64600 [Quercus suber]
MGPVILLVIEETRTHSALSGLYRSQCQTKNQKQHNPKAVEPVLPQCSSDTDSGRKFESWIARSPDRKNAISPVFIAPFARPLDRIGCGRNRCVATLRFVESIAACNCSARKAFSLLRGFSVRDLAWTT